MLHIFLLVLNNNNVNVYEITTCSYNLSVADLPVQPMKQTILKTFK